MNWCRKKGKQTQKQYVNEYLCSNASALSNIIDFYTCSISKGTEWAEAVQSTEFAHTKQKNIGTDANNYILMWTNHDDPLQFWIMHGMFLSLLSSRKLQPTKMKYELYTHSVTAVTCGASRLILLSLHCTYWEVQYTLYWGKLQRWKLIV